jgi:copper chaperone CopZ
MIQNLMKAAGPILLTLLTSAFAFGAANEAVVKISGMTCSGCEGTVQNKVAMSPLLKDKIASCTANANEGIAKMTFKDGMTMSQAELENAVGDALKETNYTVAAPTQKKAAKKKLQ